MLLGLFGEPPISAAIEQVLMRGLERFDARQCWLQVMAPVTMFLMDWTLVPYFIARVSSFFVASHLLRACVLLDPCDVLRVVERLACVAQVARRDSIFALLDRHYLDEPRDEVVCCVGWVNVL